MKVRDLIAASTFTPGAGRSSATAPRVTIILPTFRRGDSGLLQRTLDSLLGQSFGDFEIIVVDDASTDSTARVIELAMKRDPRVSVIRHQHNIGLPAVSEYEAYVLARGDLISFAFDDTVFYRHGLRRLVRESERHPDSLIAGYVTAFMRSPRGGEILSYFLGAGVRESDLLSRNVIPNNAVLAPRAILDEVGLYDPHISLARLCDYDLWLRVRRRFPIRMINTCVGEEHGPATTDSLGHTYPLDNWLSDDRMRQHRNESLTAANFEEIDVFDASTFESGRSRALVTKLAAQHLAARPWMSGSEIPATEAGRVPRIVVLAGIDASTQIYFEGLRDVTGLHVRMIDPRARPISELAEADALIIWRDLALYADWRAAAKAAHIPTFYFLDDNLPLMAEKGELDSARAAEFDPTNLRKALGDLDGVLASTEELAASFREQRLHKSVAALRLVVPADVARWHTAAQQGINRPPTFALFVGAHRLREFRRTLWPALVDAAQASGIRPRLLVPDTFFQNLRRLPNRDSVEIIPFGTSADYFVALRTVNFLGTDVVVVPPSRTVNSRFKSLHPLMSAAILEASLMVPASAPYLELSGTRGVILVPDGATRAEWTSAFQDYLASMGSTSERIPVVAEDLLDSRFGPTDGASTLLEAIQGALSPTEPDEAQRLRRIADALSVQLAVSRASTIAVTSTAAASVAVAEKLQSILRSSRQLHAMRGNNRPLSGYQYKGFPSSQRRMPGQRVELSPPLTGLSYASYAVLIKRAQYRRLAVMILADGVPGDLVGVEIVDPLGRIILHKIAALPSNEEPVLVSFDARALKVEQDATYELRIFARTGRLAFVLESVDRGRFGLRHPRVSPLVRFES